MKNKTEDAATEMLDFRRQFERANPPLLYEDGGERVWYKPPSLFERRQARVNKWSHGELLRNTALFNSLLGQGFHYRRIGVSSLSVEFVKSGNLAVRQAGSIHLLNAGDVFLMRPLVEGEMMTLAGCQCEKLSVVINGPLLDFILQRGGLSDTDVLREVDGHRFFQLFHELLDLFDRQSRNACGRHAALCYELLEFLRKPEPEKTVPPELLSLIEYMEANLASDLKLATLARRLNCSKIYLGRRFKASFGISPYQWLINARMRFAARTLLARADLSIKEVAALAGYQDQLNFSAEFRKHYKTPPREYRQRHAQ